MSETRTDPATLYANFANIEAKIHQKLPGGYGMGAGSAYQHTVQSWSAAGKTDGSDQWTAFYLVQIDSLLKTSVEGSFALYEYQYGIRLCDESGATVAGVEILAVTPDSTQGATSYTTSIDESFSASGGFFGTTPTGSLGASVSFGHSVTRQIPDITVHNRSDPAQALAAWGFEFSHEANKQDSREFTMQILFCVPTGPDDQTKKALAFDFHTIAFDDDHNGTAYHDRTVAAMQPNLGDVRLTDWNDRGFTAIQPRVLVALAKPAVPSAQPAQSGSTLAEPA